MSDESNVILDVERKFVETVMSFIDSLLAPCGTIRCYISVRILRKNELRSLDDPR
jgi:hypothetical protein